MAIKKEKPFKKKEHQKDRRMSREELERYKYYDFKIQPEPR